MGRSDGPYFLDMDMNVYRHQFVSHCPNNDQAIIYALTIETGETIYAEHITTATALHKRAFHEAIADDLYARFGGKQVITAHHHGVDIETRRGFDEVIPGRIGQRVQIGSTLYEKGVDISTVVEHAKRPGILV